MTKHTPTPWKTEQWVEDVNGLRNDWAIWTDTKGINAELASGIYEPANAAFIIKACNAHRKLVEALEIALRYVEEHLDGRLEDPNNDVAVIKRALAKAKEGEE